MTQVRNLLELNFCAVCAHRIIHHHCEICRSGVWKIPTRPEYGDTFDLTSRRDGRASITRSSRSLPNDPASVLLRGRRFETSWGYFLMLETFTMVTSIAWEDPRRLRFYNNTTNATTTLITSTRRGSKPVDVVFSWRPFSPRNLHCRPPPPYQWPNSF